MPGNSVQGDSLDNIGANTINGPSVLNQNDLKIDFKVNVTGALTSPQQVIPDMT